MRSLCLIHLVFCKNQVRIAGYGTRFARLGDDRLPARSSHARRVSVADKSQRGSLLEPYYPPDVWLDGHSGKCGKPPPQISSSREVKWN